MKRGIQEFIQWFHSALIASPIARLYAAVVLTPEKIKTVRIHGTPVKFRLTNSYVNFYVTNFTIFSRNESITQDYLKAALLPGDVLMEIGANLGCYVVWLATAFELKQVSAFEPEAENYAALVDNVRLNDLANVVCLPIAASHRGGYDTFWTRRANAGNASGFTEDYALHGDVSGAYRQIIRTERVDDLVDASIVERPDVVLIDVDGGEVMVLEGMPEALVHARAVIVEVAGETADRVHEILTGKGFALAVEKVQRRGNRIYERG
jgi:FkbM family methyltransferase